jgi:hypothetical protein
MKYVLAHDLQRLTTGGKHADTGSTLKHAIGDFRRCFDEMLATIENDQSLSVAQRPQQRFFRINKLRIEPDRGGYRADDLLPVLDG